mgnify:CR=1 FL=1
MAAAPSVTFESLKSQLAKRQYAPIYLLHGEEGYYIDALVKIFEQILPPEERDFNMYTMYAPEVSPDTVMDACRRYPMMSEYQVVILKEWTAFICITTIAINHSGYLLQRGSGKSERPYSPNKEK